MNEYSDPRFRILRAQGLQRDLNSSNILIFWQICAKSSPVLPFRVRSFGVIRIRISDTRSLGSWYIKGTDESTLITDSSVPLMHHDPSDLGSLIRIRITPNERTLRIEWKYSLHWSPGVIRKYVVSDIFNLVPRVPHLFSSLASSGKMRDPGNEVEVK